MGSFFENILKGNIAGKILSGSKGGMDLGDILGGLGKGKTAVTKDKEPEVAPETGNPEMSLENVTNNNLDDALEKIGTGETSEPAPSAPSSGGGLGDILGKIGLGNGKQPSSGGGLGDILGKLGKGGSSSKSSGGLLGAILSIIALASGSLGAKSKK